MWVKRQISALAVLLACAFAVWLGACGSDDSSVFDGGPDTSVQPDAGGGDAAVTDAGNPFGDTGTTKITSLTISPADPVVAVTIADGVVSTTPLTFTALGNGNVAVHTSFTLDRGELGSLVASTGVFTASGNVSGTGTVTATYAGATSTDGGPLVATTSVTVQITMSQNGKPPLPDGGVDAGTLGGNNGVGGNDYGGTVSSGTKTVLDGTPTAPANAQELGFLYPYDKTVWPQGILAPLLQWQTTHAAATTAVKIHLAEKGFTFDGYYAAPGWVNEPIDETAWSKALYGNQGDALEVDVYVTDGATSWGPITEHWNVAHGVLKGTVYYNSYNSKLTSTSNGAVLAIRPGAIAPTVAVPGTETSCHVCHEVSGNGGTIFIEDESNGTNYANGSSYDLTNNGAVIKAYTGTAPDGTSNYEKFVWSGVYPDGTFAMTNSTHAREHNTLPSDLYLRDTGNKVTYGGGVTETGWTNVVSQAVTPAFSPDGKHLAFNFWAGAGNGTVVPRSGHSLDIVDFDCGQGQVDGGAPTQCGSSTYAFSNLRELYYNASRWVGWPGFTPDSNGIVFHDTVTAGSCGDCEIATWFGAQAELWYTDLGASPQPVRMNWLNGLDGNNTVYIPQTSSPDGGVGGYHPNDTVLNYEPTVNPIASGGYFWVVFTSRRMYGNVASGDPYDNGNGTYPITKKLWVAAIDINPKPGTDPSHPAFYLPGQELDAGNLRGFWVVDPCKANGNACVTGDECCNGFCRQDTEGGGLVCSDNTGGCSQEFESCTTSADCCGGGTLTCINGHCAKANPN